MIVSALISECRRKYQDIPKSTQASRLADGVSTLFNLPAYPIMENSYSVYFNTSGITENTGYTLNKDSGDLQLASVQAASVNILTNYRYANWRDQHWLEAINEAIRDLNGRGFFKQIVRLSSAFRLSANVRLYSGPSACIDMYEVLQYDTGSLSAGLSKLPGNWSYQQDANKLVLGFIPTVSQRAAISYLRNLQTYAATSATLDVNDEWIPLLKEKVGEYYNRFMAMKISQHGAATIDEGHFSFTNFRTLYKDCADAYEIMAKRKKPTRPAKDIGYRVDEGGYA